MRMFLLMAAMMVMAISTLAQAGQAMPTHRQRLEYLADLLAGLGSKSGENVVGGYKLSDEYEPTLIVPRANNSDFVIRFESPYQGREPVCLGFLWNFSDEKFVVWQVNCDSATLASVAPESVIPHLNFDQNEDSLENPALTLPRPIVDAEKTHDLVVVLLRSGTTIDKISAETLSYIAEAAKKCPTTIVWTADRNGKHAELARNRARVVRSELNKQHDVPMEQMQILSRPAVSGIDGAAQAQVVAILVEKSCQ